MLTRLSVILAVLLSLSIIQAASAAEPTKDSLDVVKDNLVQKKALLVDVRETEEWKAGHLSQAMNVPLSMIKDGAESQDFAAILAQQIPKDKIVYLHCKAGARCLAAADLLKKYGYDVRPLKTGYDDLVRAGFPKAK